MQKALELPTNGFFVYNLGGANYNGNDLPVSVYSYGSACIYKRNSESIFVFLTGIANSSTPLAANWYNGASWTGWKTYVTNTDLHKVTYKKNFGGFSANSMREFLIAVINKVLENNLWTSSEDVIVFYATWFGHSYGMGILASQNGNNDIIISYDSEDGNSYTMHYVPSTNTVKTFYKRQGTSLL